MTPCTARLIVTPAWPTPSFTVMHRHKLRRVPPRSRGRFAGVSIDWIERVITDNGMSFHKGQACRQALTDLSAQTRFTGSNRPREGRQGERFNRHAGSEGGVHLAVTDSADQAASRLSTSRFCIRLRGTRTSAASVGVVTMPGEARIAGQLSVAPCLSVTGSPGNLDTVGRYVQARCDAVRTLDGSILKAILACRWHQSASAHLL